MQSSEKMYLRGPNRERVHPLEADFAKYPFVRILFSKYQHWAMMGSNTPTLSAGRANSNHERLRTRNNVCRGDIARSANPVQPDTDFRLRGTEPHSALMRKGSRP